MRTQATTVNYLQIADMIHRLSDRQKEKLFAEINVMPVATSAVNDSDKESSYNPEFVKMIQERRKGKFVSVDYHKELWN
jgi:hypothetical protein